MGFVTHGKSGAAFIDRRFHGGQAPDIIIIFPGAPVHTPDAGGNIVCRVASADLKFRVYGDEILFIPFLIRIAENKIKRSLERFCQLVCVGKSRIDIIRQPGLLEIGNRFPVSLFVYLDGASAFHRSC